MSKSFRTDESNRGTFLRLGKVLALKITGSDDESEWYRLLPDGIDATRDADFTLTLQNLRSDIDPSILRDDWLLLIANDGYEQVIDILNVNGDIILPRSPINLDPKSTGTPLPETDIQYVLLPEWLNGLNVYFDSESEGTVKISYTTEFLAPGGVGYSRQEESGNIVTPTLKPLTVLYPGDSVDIRASDVRDIFYQYSSPSESNKITWGECEIQ